MTYDPAMISRSIDTLASPDERIATDVADIQRAWLIYAANERSRSVAALAKKTGLSRGKVQSLIPVFQERWVRETEALQKAAQPYLEARVSGLVDAMVDRLEDIIRNGQDSAAVAAIKEARSIIGTPEDSPSVLIDARTQVAIGAGLDSLDAIRSLVAGNVNQNVQTVDHETASRTHRVRDRSNG